MVDRRAWWVWAWVAIPALLLALRVQACPQQPPPPAPQALAAAAAQDRGLLWSITRDGRTSYLYGTLHVGRPEWQTPGPRVRAALAATKVLALELDPSDPAVQREIGAGSVQPVPLPGPLRARLVRQLERACLDAALAGTLHPGMLAMVLGIAEARFAGLDPAWGQEFVLLAAVPGRRVVSLETVALQLQVLMPEDPEAARVLLEQTLVPLEAGRGPQVIGRLAGAWAAGDLETLATYERWCECANTEDDRAAMRALNDDRNPGLAARIAALHAEGAPVFAAVGALHMTGPKALPRLLQAAGFEVRRVPFGAQ